MMSCNFINGMFTVFQYMHKQVCFWFILDGRGRQEVCQEEAWEPEPGSGPGHWPLLPVCHVRPPGHVQEEDQDN